MIERRRSAPIPVSALVAVVLAVCGGGCSSTRSTTTGYSGFLGDLSALQEVAVDDEARVLVSQANVLADYDRFILDPVLVYFHDSSRASAVDPQELMELTSALGEEVAQELADGGYQVVKSPGPGVLRIRAAITDVDAARPGVNVAAKAAGALTLGQAFFVPAVDIGRASIEAEMRDATTGERVAVFVDARKGKRFGSTIASTRKWAHAKDAFKVWAQRLRHRLDTVHAQGDGDR